MNGLKPRLESGHCLTHEYENLAWGHGATYWLAPWAHVECWPSVSEAKLVLWRNKVRWGNQLIKDKGKRQKIKELHTPQLKFPKSKATSSLTSHPGSTATCSDPNSNSNSRSSLFAPMQHMPFHFKVDQDEDLQHKWRWSGQSKLKRQRQGPEAWSWT